MPFRNVHDREDLFAHRDPYLLLAVLVVDDAASAAIGRGMPEGHAPLLARRDQVRIMPDRHGFKTSSLAQVGSVLVNPVGNRDRLRKNIRSLKGLGVPFPR